jgi:hypothetical protein
VTGYLSSLPRAWAGQAAADAHFAGIDGVCFHGHEGCLLKQLSNRAFNRRKLGKYADWQRFGIDMVRDIRHCTGPYYLIMYRIDLSLALNEIYGEEGMKEKALRKFKSGRGIAETLDYMENLVKAPPFPGGSFPVNFFYAFKTVRARGAVCRHPAALFSYGRCACGGSGERPLRSPLVDYHRYGDGPLRDSFFRCAFAAVDRWSGA